MVIRYGLSALVATVACHWQPWERGDLLYGKTTQFRAKSVATKRLNHVKDLGPVE